MAIDLLQQVGFNKYEAEAYYALLSEGPLTGYELGKRSGVPLSRSYEMLDRLARRGLALAQPGDPPRYTAQPAEQLLAQIRANQTSTLGALTDALANVEQPNADDGFWVVRGRDNILTRVATMIGAAGEQIGLHLTSDAESRLADDLGAARARGCRLIFSPVIDHEPERAQIVLLLIDDREALVGTLEPVASCQAVVSSNPSLVTALRAAFASRAVTTATRHAPDEDADRRDWVAWEERKHQRLWRLNSGGRVA